MDKGWIKLHRRILENVFLMKDNNAYLVFTKLLMLVGKEKGQYAAGRNQLGETLNMNPRTLYGVLLRLERQQLILIDSNNKYSIITICNWKKYQGQVNKQKADTSTAAQQQRNNNATTTQHYNKKENEKKKKKGDFKIDQELAAKEHEARNRKSSSGYQKALSVAEAIKLKRLGAAK